MSEVDSFLAFLKEYQVVGLAIGVVIGTAAKDLVSAVVDDVVMPIVGVFLPGEGWRTAVYAVGAVEFRIGHLIGETLDFLIIAVLVYLVVRHLMKKEQVGKL